MFGWCNAYDTDHFSNVFVDGVGKFSAGCFIFTVETYVFSRGGPLTLIFEFIEQAANDLLHPQVLADDHASDDDADIVNL